MYMHVMCILVALLYLQVVGVGKFIMICADVFHASRLNRGCTIIMMNDTVSQFVYT